MWGQQQECLHPVGLLPAYLNYEDHGGDEVKDEGAVPHIELRNLASFEHNALAQVVSGNKRHIPADQQLK